MIAKGTHPAVVVPVVSQKTGEELVCQFGHSENKGTAQVAVCFEIVAGPHSGERITWIGYFTDKSEDRTLQALRIAGFAGDDLDAFNGQHPNQEVHLVVDHEVNPKDGETYAKVQWVNDPKRSGGFVMSKPMEAKERRMFAARFKSKLKGIPVVEGEKAVRQPRSAAPPVAPTNGGWSGNDAPDPPRDNGGGGGYRTGVGVDAPPPADDEIPFLTAD